MYNSSRKNSRLLGFSYLFLAALGLCYFVISYYTPATNTDKAYLADQKNAQLMMLAFIFIELVLATYVRTATNTYVLFAQSLATMLIFTGHIFVSVGYFSGQQNATFNAALGVYVGAILLAIAVLLHLTYLAEGWIEKQTDRVQQKHHYKDENPFAEVDALYGEY